VQTGATILVALAGAAIDVGRSLLKAVVPLIVGLISAVIAGTLYAVFLPGARIHDYFSAAAQVGAGVLVALIVELRADTDLLQISFLQRQARVGILILTAIGCASSLTGIVITGSAVADGFLFGLSWGGSTAGVTGLFLLVLNRFDINSSHRPRKPGVEG
jgi:hypothetical protein